MERGIVSGGVRDACVECVFGDAVEGRWRQQGLHMGMARVLVSRYGKAT